MRPTSRLHRIFAALLILLPIYAQALPGDRDQPIKIAADSAELNEREGIAVYVGKVQMQQGSMQIEADKVTLYSDDSGIRRVIAIGKPAHYNHRRVASEPITHAYGDRIEYDVNKGQVVLTRNAVLVQDGDTFSGNTIFYDQKQGLVNAQSDSEKGSQRVQMVIQPKKKQD